MKQILKLSRKKYKKTTGVTFFDQFRPNALLIGLCVSDVSITPNLHK